MITPKELRTRRLAQGITTTDLASRLGIPEQTLVEWEKGELPIDDPPRLASLLESLEKSRRSA